MDAEKVRRAADVHRLAQELTDAICLAAGEGLDVRLNLHDSMTGCTYSVHAVISVQIPPDNPFVTILAINEHA